MKDRQHQDALEREEAANREVIAALGQLSRDVQGPAGLCGAGAGQGRPTARSSPRAPRMAEALDGRHLGHRPGHGPAPLRGGESVVRLEVLERRQPASERRPLGPLRTRAGGTPASSGVRSRFPGGVSPQGSLTRVVSGGALQRPRNGRGLDAGAGLGGRAYRRRHSSLQATVPHPGGAPGRRHGLHTRGLFTAVAARGRLPPRRPYAGMLQHGAPSEGPEDNTDLARCEARPGRVRAQPLACSGSDESAERELRPTAPDAPLDT